MTTTEHPKSTKTDEFAEQFAAALRARVDRLEDRLYQWRAITVIMLVTLLVAVVAIITVR